MVFNLCSWVFLLRQEQGLNHIKMHKIKGHWIHELILKFRKLVQNVDQRVDQNVLMIVQKVVHQQPRFIKNVKNMQEHLTWIKGPEKYISMDVSAIKAWTSKSVKKVFKVHSRLWTLEVLGIFQGGYYPRGYFTALQLCLYY